MNLNSSDEPVTIKALPVSPPSFAYDVDLLTRLYSIFSDVLDPYATSLDSSGLYSHYVVWSSVSDLDPSDFRVTVDGVNLNPGEPVEARKDFGLFGNLDGEIFYEVLGAGQLTEGSYEVIFSLRNAEKERHGQLRSLEVLEFGGKGTQWCDLKKSEIDQGG
jgi:hypothetical protein